MLSEQVKLAVFWICAHRVSWKQVKSFLFSKIRLVVKNICRAVSMIGGWAQGASWVPQMVKNLSTMWETWVRSLGWEDPLEEGMATHSRILAWRSPWREEPGRLQSMGLKRVGYD